MSYKSTHTGAQIDAGVSAALNPDATPTADSNALVKSGGVAAALANKADNDVVALKAPTNSPAFAGTPTAPTPTAGDNSTKVATTAFVAGEIATADDAQEQNIYNVYPTDTVENASVASFTDGADGIPVKELTVNITPVQAAGTPTPESPLPISGWTGANINRAVKSIVPVDYAEISRANFDITVTKKTIRKDWVDQGTNQYFLAQIADSFTGYDNLPAGLYSFKGKFDSNRTPITNGVYARFSDEAGIEYADAVLNGAPVQVGAGWKLSIIYSNIGTNWLTDDWATLTDYAIGIDPIVYKVSWQTEAGTVYGGTLRDNGDGTWTLTVTHAGLILDGVAGEYTYYENPNRVTIGRLFPSALRYALETANHAICDRFVPVISSSSGSGLSINDNGFNFYIDGSVGQSIYEIRFNVTGLGYSSVDEFKTYLANQYAADTPVTVCYPLQTPIEYTLTAESVKTLLGQNNVFADCGDIAALTYRADVGLYIAKKLAEA